MKKTFVSFCVMVGLLSCASTRNTAVLADISGEWYIIEMDGSAVVPAPGQPFPYIGFDVTSGRISGNAGCNRMMGSFDVGANPGRIDLKQTGTTRMTCSDMTLENNVLSTLAKVKKYVKLGEENVMLYGNSKRRPLIVLKKKIMELTLADLEGKWKITEANGMPVPENMEHLPFIEFDIAGESVHGNAGCNIINGIFKTEESMANSISFPNIISTMMACPDLEVEDNIKKALNATKTFARPAYGDIGLYDGEGTAVMILSKEE